MYALIRPLLFALAPETAHHLTLDSLRWAQSMGISGWLSPPVANSKPSNVMGITFPNRVGLAAGLDKNAAYIQPLAAMGFGFIEVGTVTPRAQPGNAQPRLFRLPQQRALINRMGFNNLGVTALLDNVRAAQFNGVLGINIGKNADTPLTQAVDDYLLGLNTVYPYASYVAINISSPNTKNLRSLQMADAMGDLLRQLKDAQIKLTDQHGRYVPMAVKIAPDLSSSDIIAIANTLKHYRMDAVIATNTTLDHSSVQHLPHGDETGGLSGAPLAAASTRVIRQLAHTLAGELPIIGVGGIMCGADAQEKIDAGASLVQVYSGLIYRGPALINECVRALSSPPA